MKKLSEMSKEEKKIAVAVFEGIQTEGWWCPRCEREVASAFVRNDETHDIRDGGCGCLVEGMPTPDYPEDQNAIIRAVSRLTDEQYSNFTYHLVRATGQDPESGWLFRPLQQATAEQHTDALLLTIGAATL